MSAVVSDMTAQRNRDAPDQLVAVDEQAVLAVVGDHRRRRWRRVLVWGVLVGLLAAGAVVLRGYLRRPPPVPTYETEPVERGDIDETVDATGTLEAKRVVSVGGEISGRIATVEVEVNDRVRAGDVLATLDPVSLENAVTEARGTLAQAKIEVTRAKAALQAAEITRNRTDALWTKGLVSREELDSAVNAHELAKADSDRAKSERTLAGVRVEQAETNKAKATIVAPIDGVVLSRSVEPGNAIAASLEAPELFKIAEDLAVMRLDLGVDEADVGRVHEGQAATFTVDAWPGKTFAATVERVNLAPDTETATVVTYTTVLAVDNDEQLLRPGMTATATILVAAHPDVLRVPTAALRFDPTKAIEQAVPASRGGGSPFGMPMAPPLAKRKSAEPLPEAGGRSLVHVLRDGELTPVPVSTGASDGRFTEVQGPGLAEGDAVVVAMTLGSMSSGETPSKMGPPP